MKLTVSDTDCLWLECFGTCTRNVGWYSKPLGKSMSEKVYKFFCSPIELMGDLAAGHDQDDSDD